VAEPLPGDRLSLDHLVTHPEMIPALAPATRSLLLTQLGALALALAAWEPIVETNSASASDDLGILTTQQLADLWKMEEPAIRALCRSGRLPAKKLGEKAWIISRAELRAWLPKRPVDTGVGVTLTSPHVTRRHPEAPEATRPYTAVVRKASGRIRNHGQPLGERPSRTQQHDEDAS